MPTYEYRCASCEHQFERFQRMTDEPVKECELCGGPVQRLLFAVPIHFKGKGFYTTDYGRQSRISSAGGGSGGNGSKADAESAAGCGTGKPDKVENKAESTAATAPSPVG